MIDSYDYFKIAKVYLDRTKETQRDNIYTAAALMGDCIVNNGIIQLFGVKHNRAFSMELGYRAGGLMPYHQIKVDDLALRGIMPINEVYADDFYNRSDVAQKLWNLYNIDNNDLFIIICDSGIDKATIDFAYMVKNQQHKLIVVTSMNTTQRLSSKHESGKKLYELADLVIDNGADYPDTLLSIDNNIKVGQISGISGNMIAQMITAEIYKYLTNNGHEVPILLSANVTGADVHNRKISDVYLNRWNS